MNDIDNFASDLLEQAKRFLEIANDCDGDGKAAHLNAALMLGFCSLEAHVNAIADDFAGRDDLSVHDKSILFEQDVRLTHGEFVLSDSLKIFRLEDRIQFFCVRLSGTPLDRGASWWSELNTAMKLRNTLTHPKDAAVITEDAVKRALQSIINGINYLYKAIYKRPFPAGNMGLQSNLSF
jgi:hypothetical protein